MCHNLDLILLNFQKHLLLWTMQRDECHISPCRPLVALASLFLKVVAFFQSVFGDAAFSKSRESPIRTDMELLSDRSMILKTPTKNPVGISLKYIKCIFFFNFLFVINFRFQRHSQYVAQGSFTWSNNVSLPMALEWHLFIRYECGTAIAITNLIEKISFGKDFIYKSFSQNVSFNHLSFRSYYYCLHSYHVS